MSDSAILEVMQMTADNLMVVDSKFNLDELRGLLFDSSILDAHSCVGVVDRKYNNKLFLDNQHFIGGSMEKEAKKIQNDLFYSHIMAKLSAMVGDLGGATRQEARQSPNGVKSIAYFQGSRQIMIMNEIKFQVSYQCVYPHTYRHT